MLFTGFAYPAKIQDEFIGEDKPDNNVWREVKYIAGNAVTKQYLYKCLPNSHCLRFPDNDECKPDKLTGRSCQVEYLSRESVKFFKMQIVGNSIMYNNSHYDSRATVDEMESRGMFVWRFKAALPSIWVMDDDGNLYIAPLQYPGHFNHSSFLAGKPVLCAGEVWVVNGSIVRMNNKSGHYKPENKEFINALKVLKMKGYTKSIEIEFSGKDKISDEDMAVCGRNKENIQSASQNKSNAKQDESRDGYNLYIVP